MHCATHCEWIAIYEFWENYVIWAELNASHLKLEMGAKIFQGMLKGHISLLKLKLAGTENVKLLYGQMDRLLFLLWQLKKKV